MQVKDKLLLLNIVKFTVEPLAEPQALAQAQCYDALYHQKGDSKKLMSICLTVNTCLTRRFTAQVNICSNSILKNGLVFKQLSQFSLFVNWSLKNMSKRIGQKFHWSKKSFRLPLCKFLKSLFTSPPHPKWLTDS